MTLWPTHRRIAGAIAAAVLSAAAPATAFTVEQQRLCTGDAFRLCGGEQPSIERIVSCMRLHRSDLSQACRAVFDK